MSRAAADEVSRREKLRLRELQRQKKENMERMREQQNKLAGADEVGAMPHEP